MKFLNLIEHRLALLEADQPDAAMPPENTTNDAASAIDDLASQSQDQVQQNVKLCADIITGLIVFFRGKFSDQIGVVPGLEDQLKDLEQTATVTDISKSDLTLLKSLYDKVGQIKSL